MIWLEHNKTNLKRLLLTVLLGLALAACSGGNGQAENETDEEEDKEVAIPVEMADVTRDTVFAAYSGTATLAAEAEADIVAKTSGVILQILVEEGDFVSANQIVAKLDGDRLRLEAERAKANLEKLQNDFKRSQELYEKRLISHDQFEKLRYDVESQKATYELARLELSYINVRSPIEGVVSERLVKTGKLVSQFEPLFRVDDFDPLEAVLFVPEKELRTLRPGLTAEVGVDAVAGETFAGTVARISPIVDASTGTFKVTVEMPQPDPRLKPGMFGRINIVHDVREDVVTIPHDALIVEDRGAFVYVLDWQQPKVIEDDEEEGNGEEDAEPKMTTEGYRSVRQIVETGYRTGGRVEVLGLEPGQRVVTSGKGSITDDVLLDVINLPADDQPTESQLATPDTELDEATDSDANAGAQVNLAATETTS